jgi:hypothetical protein
MRAEEGQIGSTRVQSFFRGVNERVAACVRDPRVRLEVVCECGRESCAALLPMSFAEYEAVRRFPTWFVVAPGHGDAELERVVSGGEAHEVVEKRGAGALAAVRLDPRRRRRLDHLHGADAA